MLGKLRHFNPLQAPYIKVNVKITNPGITNGKPNIVNENRYVLAPSAKKIGTYIRNQLFGSDLLTQAEGLNINWVVPTLAEALELSVYERESFVYIHKFDNKIYLECIKKCDIHNLVQRYDKVYSCDIIQDFEGKEFDYCLKRHIVMENGNTELTFEAFKREKDRGEWQEMSLNSFNEINGTEYERVYELPYEVLINIDIGQDFFKDSIKFLNEEMEVFNTLCKERVKTETRIATTQHYQSGDIYNQWSPSNIYDYKSISVGELQDYFTLLPGDQEHAIFEFLQGNLRVDDYVNEFKFCDYQVIQLANLSPASFGYEKDAYQNVASIDLSMNTTEMTIEAIKKQIEPQINHLFENIVKLQELLNIEDETKIPSDLVWEYGDNEKLSDDKKIKTIQAIQRAMSIPYSTRAKILTPILKKLIDVDIDADTITEEYNKEKEDLKLTYEEF